MGPSLTGNKNRIDRVATRFGRMTGNVERRNATDPDSKSNWNALWVLGDPDRCSGTPSKTGGGEVNQLIIQ